MDPSELFQGYTNMDRMIDGFNRNGITWLVHMSGGEPFLFPNFLELCQKLSRNHYMSINTNLSTDNVFEFGRRIDPERVKYIQASVHLRQRGGGLDDFIRRVIFLKSRRFKIFVSYLMYPEDMVGFEKTFQRFIREGIILFPKLYRGVWRNEFLHPGIKRRMRRFSRLRPLLKRTYPQNYSEREKRFIRFFYERSLRLAGDDYFDSDCTSDLSKETKWLDGVPDWRGRLCYAGVRSLRMDPWGKVTRCHSEHRVLGNLFEGEVRPMEEAEPCKSRICYCPYYGERYLVDPSGGEVKTRELPDKGQPGGIPDFEGQLLKEADKVKAI